MRRLVLLTLAAIASLTCCWTFAPSAPAQDTDFDVRISWKDPAVRALHFYEVSALVYKVDRDVSVSRVIIVSRWAVADLDGTHKLFQLTPLIATIRRTPGSGEIDMDLWRFSMQVVLQMFQKARGTGRIQIALFEAAEAKPLSEAGEKLLSEGRAFPCPDCQPRRQMSQWLDLDVKVGTFA